MSRLKTALEVYGALSGTEKPLVVASLLLERLGVSIQEYPKLSFIRARPNLNRVNPELNKTPLEYFSELLDEMDTFDVISEVYGNDYSYSGKDGHNLGIVLTPPHIVSLCCELLELHAGDSVFEPCCGTGRFLVNAIKHVGDSVTGIELQEDMYTLSNINVKVNGGENSRILNGDFFSEDFNGERFTAAFMNPPYSQKVTELEFIARLLNLLEVKGRAAVIVPVSTMIGKTKADKQIKASILEHHTLKGVITLNKDTFYGVGTVPCIALFTAGIPHPRKHESMFVNFEDDGYEVKKHIGLVATNRSKSRREYLLNCWRGECKDYRTGFMVKSRVEADDEWLHAFYYYNDEIPTQEDFERSVAGYLAFEANMIFHGRGYLFEGGEKNAKRPNQDTKSRRRRPPRSGQVDEEEPQQYRIIFDD